MHGSQHYYLYVMILQAFAWMELKLVVSIQDRFIVD